MANSSRLIVAVFFAFFFVCAGGTDLAADTLTISNQLSPLDTKRPLRPETRYIVLHTTEGATCGALRKVNLYGEAHYLLAKSGEVFRIIDKAKIATHTGRSMWEGRSPMDNYSIGIEIVGYHDRDINDDQYAALRELLRQLKGIYQIKDKDILTHSMVAYGLPNKFYPKDHRGRKRCGMMFARPDVRKRLGLSDGPSRDPDVEAGRLTVGDEELFACLYPGARGPAETAKYAVLSKPDSVEPAEPMVITKGVNAWSIAREKYAKPTTLYSFPNGKTLRGNEIKEWDNIPAGTRVSYLDGEQEREQEFDGFREIGKDGDTVHDLAGELYAADTTIYFFPNGMIRTGAELKNSPKLSKLFKDPPKGTRVLMGYVYGGYVKNRQAASRMVGKQWNYPSTYYQLRDGRILSGDEINDKEIPAKTRIFFQQYKG